MLVSMDKTLMAEALKLTYPARNPHQEKEVQVVPAVKVEMLEESPLPFSLEILASGPKVMISLPFSLNAEKSEMSESL